MSRSSRISVGVIGTGGMGGLHTANLYTSVVGAHLAAVSDVDGRRAGEVADLFGGAEVFTDALKMIHSDTVDAVIIASPDSTHAPLTLECIERGKPVLCEKPLAENARDAYSIVEAEIEVGKKLVQVGFMRRYDPQHLAVKTTLDSGAVGSPVVFKGWHRNVDVPPTTKDSATVVVNSTIHDIDSARWFLGDEISEVRVRGANTAPELGSSVWNIQLLDFTTVEGRLGSIETNVVARYGYEVGVEVVAESGVVTTPPPQDAVVRSDQTAVQSIEYDWLERFQTAYVDQLRSWISSLQNGTQDGPNAWDGYSSLVVAEACIESIRSGSAVAVERLEVPGLYLDGRKELR